MSEQGEMNSLKWQVRKLTAEVERLREQTRWHPYPEEKPSGCGEYEITDSGGGVTSDWYVLDANRNPCWEKDYKVIAFRELPEAYQPPEDTGKETE